MRKCITILINILIAACSIYLIFLANRYATKNNSTANLFNKEVELNQGVIAKVLEIKIIQSDENLKLLYFNAKILTGTQKNTTVTAMQSVEEQTSIMPTAVSINDFVILYPIENNDKTEWLFENYCRIDKIFILSSIFILLVIFLCGIKGLNTIISLIITLLTLLYVLVPFIISGFNIYLSTIYVCFFIIFISLFITHGVNFKSLAAGLGCCFGVTFSGLLEIFMQKTMKLTGYINEDATAIFNLSTEHPIDLRGIIFAMIIIGCLGATMDVAMSISSALYELKINTNHLTNKMIFTSGMNIGKDTIGTMANTLILAYIGTSLMRVILYTISDYPLMILMNKEELIVDFLQSLSGVMGILITIPVTTLFCSMMYKKRQD